MDSLTAVIGTSGNFIVLDTENENDVSFTDYGVGANYFLGGSQLAPRSESFMFLGLNENELTVTQFMMLNLGLQYNIKSKLFVIPHVDIDTVGFKDFNEYINNAFTAKGQWEDFDATSFLFSSGLT